MALDCLIWTVEGDWDLSGPPLAVCYSKWSVEWLDDGSGIEIGKTYFCGQLLFHVDVAVDDGRAVGVGISHCEQRMDVWCVGRRSSVDASRCISKVKPESRAKSQSPLFKRLLPPSRRSLLHMTI